MRDGFQIRRRVAESQLPPSGRPPAAFGQIARPRGPSSGDRLSTLSNCTAFGARNYPAGAELPRMVHAVAKPRAERALQRASSRRRPAAPTRQKPKLSSDARRCRAKFLEYFPAAFHDADYLASERAYKWDAHRRWEDVLDPNAFRALLAAERYQEIAAQAVSIEARTNLLVLVREDGVA